MASISQPSDCRTCRRCHARHSVEQCGHARLQALELGLELGQLSCERTHLIAFEPLALVHTRSCASSPEDVVCRVLSVARWLHIRVVGVCVSIQINFREPPSFSEEIWKRPMSRRPTLPTHETRHRFVAQPQKHLCGELRDLKAASRARVEMRSKVCSVQVKTRLSEPVAGRGRRSYVAVFEHVADAGRTGGGRPPVHHRVMCDENRS